jgi:hypothetical protein
VTRRWLRLEPGRRENLTAAGIAFGAAAAVGAVVFYFGRILISREEVTPGRAVAERDEERGAPPERRLPRRTGRRG